MADNLATVPIEQLQAIRDNLKAKRLRSPDQFDQQGVQPIPGVNNFQSNQNITNDKFGAFTDNMLQGIEQKAQNQSIPMTPQPYQSGITPGPAQPGFQAPPPDMAAITGYDSKAWLPTKHADGYVDWVHREPIQKPGMYQHSEFMNNQAGNDPSEWITPASPHVPKSSGMWSDNLMGGDLFWDAVSPIAADFGKGAASEAIGGLPDLLSRGTPTGDAPGAFPTIWELLNVPGAIDSLRSLMGVESQSVADVGGVTSVLGSLGSGALRLPKLFNKSNELPTPTNTKTEPKMDSDIPSPGSDSYIDLLKAEGWDNLSYGSKGSFDFDDQVDLFNTYVAGRDMGWGRPYNIVEDTPPSLLSRQTSTDVQPGFNLFGSQYDVIPPRTTEYPSFVQGGENLWSAALARNRPSNSMRDVLDPPITDVTGAPTIDDIIGELGRMRNTLGGVRSRLDDSMNINLFADRTRVDMLRNQLDNAIDMNLDEAKDWFGTDMQGKLDDAFQANKATTTNETISPQDLFNNPRVKKGRKEGEYFELFKSTKPGGNK